MKTRLAKLISLFLAALLCLMSCTSDGGVTEGTDTPDSAASPIQEDGSIDYGAINLSAFSDTVSDAEMMEGYLPPKAKAMVKEFIETNRAELEEMWETGIYRKLPPIK